MAANSMQLPYGSLFFAIQFFCELRILGFEFSMTRSFCESLVFATLNFCVSQKPHMHFPAGNGGLGPLPSLNIMFKAVWMLRCGDQSLEVTARLTSQLETVTIAIPEKGSLFLRTLEFCEHPCLNFRESWVLREIWARKKLESQKKASHTVCLSSLKSAST